MASTMTKHEALTSMAQTLLRSRLGYGVIHPSLSQIARAVADIAKIATKAGEPMFEVSDENAAIIELAHRYELQWPVKPKFVTVGVDRHGPFVR